MILQSFLSGPCVSLGICIKLGFFLNGDNMIFCDPLCARFQISFYAQWSLLIFSTINPHLTEAHILTALPPNPPSLLSLPVQSSSLGFKIQTAKNVSHFGSRFRQLLETVKCRYDHSLTIRVPWCPGMHVYCFLTLQRSFRRSRLGKNESDEMNVSRDAPECMFIVCWHSEVIGAEMALADLSGAVSGAGDGTDMS